MKKGATYHVAVRVKRNEWNDTVKTEVEIVDLAEARLADDVELPARELRREAHVLPLAADGERQLLVRDDELHAVVRLVDDDLVHLGGLNGVDDVTS